MRLLVHGRVRHRLALVHSRQGLLDLDRPGKGPRRHPEGDLGAEALGKDVVAGGGLPHGLTLGGGVDLLPTGHVELGDLRVGQLADDLAHVEGRVGAGVAAKGAGGEMVAGRAVVGEGFTGLVIVRALVDLHAVGGRGALGLGDLWLETDSSREVGVTELGLAGLEEGRSRGVMVIMGWGGGRNWGGDR